MTLNLCCFITSNHTDIFKYRFNHCGKEHFSNVNEEQLFETS